MTVRDIASKLSLEIVNDASLERDVLGAYSGDLLSWVMTRLDPDFIWVTIMNNVNILAVASLSDAAAIVLTENAEIDESVLNRAREEGINLLRTSKSSFETSYLIGKTIYGE